MRIPIEYEHARKLLEDTQELLDTFVVSVVDDAAIGIAQACANEAMKNWLAEHPIYGSYEPSAVAYRARSVWDVDEIRIVFKPWDFDQELMRATGNE